jgi:hypothetical protein
VIQGMGATLPAKMLERHRLTAALEQAIDVRRALALDLGHVRDRGREELAAVAALYAATARVDALLARLERLLLLEDRPN